MFLKIVTKWQKIKKSKLNNSLTNRAFQKIVSHSILLRRAFLKLLICFAMSWIAVNLVTSFSRQKALKSKNKKHRIFWNTKFYHLAKFELKRIKNAKVVATSQYFSSHTPTVNLIIDSIRNGDATNQYYILFSLFEFHCREQPVD